MARPRGAKQRAAEVVERLAEEYPGSAKELCALQHDDPYQLLIATILSAQSTDETVNLVTATLFQKYKTAEDYLRVPEDELKADIHATGFFNQKALSIREACRRIVEEYGGEVPGTMEDLITLRGVARKTANIVLGNSFGIVEGIAVDTHVHRVSNRLGLSDQKNPDKIEAQLMERIPRERWFDFTYVLIDHGRAICTAKRPKCPECPVEDLCPASQA
jgi:endonuclease III